MTDKEIVFLKGIAEYAYNLGSEERGYEEPYEYIVKQYATHVAKEKTKRDIDEISKDILNEFQKFEVSNETND